MKTPLRFQITEYDCGTTALLNALCFLFDREEIPAELVKAIHNYTLDSYDKDGNLGQGGTSKESIDRLSKWIDDYANHRNFGISCTRYEGKIINRDLIEQEIQKGAVLFVRCWQNCEHYIIITDIDCENAYIWDPYYLDDNYYDKDNEVKIIFDKPFSYNRIVKLIRLFSNTTKDFALLEENIREMVSISKGNEHYHNLNKLNNLENITKILDAGSGRTSLGYLTSRYPKIKVDAIVYPGDIRKINSIKENIKGNYNLVELDLCSSVPELDYDLVLAHLLLGEAVKFGNCFQDLLRKLLNIKSTYYIIYDFLEDLSIDYNYLENYLNSNGYKIINKLIFAKEQAQQFNEFVGKNYIGYLIKKD